MALSAVVEVELVVRVTVKLESEQATEAELSRFVAGHADEVRRSVEKIIGRSGSEPEVGWLDDERVVFATDVTLAEVPDTILDAIPNGRLATVANDPKVVR